MILVDRIDKLISVQLSSSIGPVWKK